MSQEVMPVCLGGSAPAGPSGNSEARPTDPKGVLEWVSVGLQTL